MQECMRDCDDTEEVEGVAPPVDVREWLVHLVWVQVERFEMLHVTRW